MTAGRRPVPNVIKMLRGTDQPCRINKKEPKPKSDNIAMPAGMSKQAQKHWDLVSKQLKEAGILTNLDVHALEIYCESYALWKDATDKINTHGAVVKGNNGFPVRSPYLMVAQRGFDQMRTMLTEFGMTPSSRTRVNSTDEKSDNPFDN